jgi:probable rRNA maturation factor
MIDFIDETGKFENTARLLGVLGAYLNEAGLQEREFTLVLLDDAMIRTFNQRDRGLNEATDVLSYPAAEPDDVGMPVTSHLGDVFISTETAARQAAEQQHSLLEEVLVLAVHGLTHLLGYDHATEDEWRIFEAGQSRVLELNRLQPSRW